MGSWLCHTWMHDRITTSGAGHYIFVVVYIWIEEFAVRGNFSYLTWVVLNRWRNRIKLKVGSLFTFWVFNHPDWLIHTAIDELISWIDSWALDGNLFRESITITSKLSVWLISLELVRVLVGWWRPSLLCMHIIRKAFLICGSKLIDRLFEISVIKRNLLIILSVLLVY